MTKITITILILMLICFIPFQSIAFDDNMIIDRISSSAGITKEQAIIALETVKKSIIDALKKENGKVSLEGFGTFKKVRRKARKGRNPQTGEPIQIKARDVVKFLPSKKLKDEI